MGRVWNLTSQKLNCLGFKWYHFSISMKTTIKYIPIFSGEGVQNVLKGLLAVLTGIQADDHVNFVVILLLYFVR